MVVRPPGGHKVIFLLSFIFSVSLCLFHTDLSEFNLWNRWILCKHNSWTCLSYCSGKHRHPTPHLCSRTYVSSSFSHLSSFPLFSLTVFVKRGGNLGKTGRLSREPMADSKHEAFDLGVRGCTLRYCWSAHPEACLSSSQADTMQHQRGGRRKGREGGG